MKKAIFTTVITLISLTAFSQLKELPQRLKYVTQAPDGSIAMTIYDDTREDIMKLESVDNFYKYEILEPSTSEAVFSSRNKGKECAIDKTKFAPGTYNLRLYTSSFVITSKITIVAARKIYSSSQSAKKILASRE